MKLGLRTVDLAPDEQGNARPENGGISVVSSIAGFRRRVEKNRFPPKMLPARLNYRGIVPGAAGPEELRVFRIGEGDFERGPLTPQLALVPDGDGGHHDDHGTLQPAAMMPYEVYRSAIAETRDRWVDGENDA